MKLFQVKLTPKVLLFGEHSYSDVKNNSDLMAKIGYFNSTKRFDTPLNDKLTGICLYISSLYQNLFLCYFYF